MIELVTLDLDDTLWDPRPAFLRAEAEQYTWLQVHAPAVTRAHDLESMRALRVAYARAHPALAHDFTRLRHAALAALLAEFGCDPALADPAIETFVRMRSQVELFPDARPALADLARDHVLIALTNGNADLAVAGVAGYFAACISPAEAGVQKPDPRMFEVALQRAGVPPERAVHVGDQPLYDIEGAHRAAVRSVWLNRAGLAWPAEYRPPHAEIASLAELRPALAALAA